MQPEQLAFRSVLTYHPEWGHVFIPDLTARIRHPYRPYFLKTDERGFRNGYFRFDKPVSGEKSILFLGDSFAAGDGVANEHRFSDQLQANFDCRCYNAAMPGLGADQQLLIYRGIKGAVQHDILVFAPHLDDLNRNMLSSRVGVDRQNGQFIHIPKPYFELEDGKLNLKNVPVPRQREAITINTSAPAEYSSLKVELSRLKSRLTDTIEYRLLKKQINSALADANSREWMLMDAIIRELINESAGKPVILMPIPQHEHILKGMAPAYLRLFERYADNHQIFVIDILELLKFENKKHPLFLPSCGHFREEAHHAIASHLGGKLAEFTLLRHRNIPLEYIQTTKDNYVLGLSCFYHDSAAAILKNGQPIAAAHEERFTRVKHDKRFPVNAINYCLEKARIDISELAAVCYYDDESLTLERAFVNMASLEAISAKKFWETYQGSLHQKANMAGIIRKSLQYGGKVFKALHHRSHAASAFYPSPFSEAAIVIADGVGEWATMTIAHGNAQGIRLITEQHYPHSIGLLYSAFTYFCGFKVNSGEYKLMGLAPYGTPIYSQQIQEHIVDLQEDGSIHLNMDYFRFQYGEQMVSDRFAKLFGVPPRAPESRITQIYMDIAASIQEVTEEIMMRVCRHARLLTGSDYLVLAGGVALNCVANGKILREDIFKDIWIQPAAGDAGGALGAALEFYFSPENPVPGKRRWPMKHACLGPAFSKAEIKSFLRAKGLPFHQFTSEERGTTIAGFIKDNKVVGHFNGSMEYGPRALGARSILGNSMDPEAQRKINLKIKFRESFRPFAPAVLEEKASEYFELDRPSPYMLLVAPVREEKRIVSDQLNTEDLLLKVNQQRSVVPAITHIDYSARIQTVGPEDGETGFYEIIRSFYEQTGCPVIVNTSFNVRGEPIVCTPFEAYQCFMRTDMDILVLGDFYLIKEEQPAWSEEKDWREEFALD